MPTGLDAGYHVKLLYCYRYSYIKMITILLSLTALALFPIKLRRIKSASFFRGGLLGKWFSWMPEASFGAGSDFWKSWLYQENLKSYWIKQIWFLAGKLPILRKLRFLFRQERLGQQGFFEIKKLVACIAFMLDCYYTCIVIIWLLLRQPPVAWETTPSCLADNPSLKLPIKHAFSFLHQD